MGPHPCQCFEEDAFATTLLPKYQRVLSSGYFEPHVLPQRCAVWQMNFINVHSKANMRFTVHRGLNPGVDRHKSWLTHGFLRDSMDPILQLQDSIPEAVKLFVLLE